MTRSTRYVFSATLLVFAAGAPAAAQESPTPAANFQRASNSPQTTDVSHVRAGFMVFAGYGRTDFGGATTDVIPKVIAHFQGLGLSDVGTTLTDVKRYSANVGGAVLIRFNNPFGLNIGFRLQDATGPVLIANAVQGSLHARATSHLDWRTTALTMGATLNFGDDFFIEPMVDMNFWRTSTTTVELFTGGDSVTSLVARRGRQPGIAVRAAAFLSRSIGVGAEYRLIRFNDAAPDVAAAPWRRNFQANQLLAMFYYRLME